MEHTDNYDQIISEFKRVLKPDGKLIVTFDISLDGKDDIPVDEAEALITVLGNSFETTADDLQSVTEFAATPYILTTDFAYTLDPKLIWCSPPTFQVV